MPDKMTRVCTLRNKDMAHRAVARRPMLFGSEIGVTCGVPRLIGPPPPAGERVVSLAKNATLGFDESNAMLRNISANGPACVGIDCPVLSLIEKANPSGIPPASTLFVVATVNSRLVPGVNGWM